MEILTVWNVKREKAFILIGHASRNSKRVISNDRLEKRESGEDRSVITKPSMLQKDNRSVFYT